MTDLLKYSDNLASDKLILNDAIQNIGKGIAVMQSLKVIRKIIKMKDSEAEILEYVMKEDFFINVFSSLKMFKLNLKEAVEKSGSDLTKLDGVSINQFLQDKNFTFEKNILKRLRFIDSVIYYKRKDESQIIPIMNMIWDELVVNSIVVDEILYFKKWFIKFTSGDGDVEQINKDLL